MSTEESPAGAVPTWADKRQVIRAFEVSGIQILELAGRRKLGDTPSESVAPPESRPEDMEFRVYVHDSAEDFRVRVELEYETEKLELKVDAVVKYSKSEPFMVADELNDALIQELAIMTLFPFLRQNVHDLSSRLGHPFLMGLLQLGSLRPQSSEVEPDED